MTETIIAVVVAVLGSSGIFTFVQFMIRRKDDKTGTLQRIEKSLESLKRDSVRSQLLMMMADYPDNIEEILKLGERYFVDLDGNWYMGTLFNQWLEKKNLPRPNWYKHE